jgi:hypothetical protein
LATTYTVLPASSRGVQPLGKLFSVEEEKFSKPMHCSARNGTAKAPTIAPMAILRSRTLTAERRIGEKTLFKTNPPIVVCNSSQRYTPKPELSKI